jgi:hypothetical protein
MEQQEAPMLRPSFSSVVAATLSLLLLSTPAFAFNFPLSDEAIREAYFLGQRRDESMAQFLGRYKKVLAAPATGPHIASVEFLTPFASLILLSSQRTNYSAQQAALDYRRRPEVVVITIKVLFTSAYGAFLAAPTDSHSNSPTGYTLRSTDFWRDIDVQVVMDNKFLEPSDFTGEPDYLCDDNGCNLSGATIRLEFPAKNFTSDSAAVQIAPPEGPDVSTTFNLIALR